MRIDNSKPKLKKKKENKEKNADTPESPDNQRTVGVVRRWDTNRGYSSNPSLTGKYIGIDLSRDFSTLPTNIMCQITIVTLKTPKEGRTLDVECEVDIQA